MSDIPVFGIRGRVDQTSGATNSLVVGRIETTTPFSGLRLIEDGQQIQEAIQNKDWVSGSLAGAALAGDTLAMLFDPIGTAVAMGVGWMLDHVSPLKEWLNELTGDAGAVAGTAATWQNISKHLATSAEDLRQGLRRLEEMRGQTVEAAKALQKDLIDHVQMVSGLASSFSVGLELASSLVQMVHDLVRDAIADVIGSLASAAITAVATVGTGIPKVIADILIKVAKWSAKLGQKIKSLITSFLKLSGLMKAAERTIADTFPAFERVAANLSLGGAAHHLSLERSAGSIDPRRHEILDGQRSLLGSLHGAMSPDEFRELFPGEYILPASPSVEITPFSDPNEFIGLINPKFEIGAEFQMNCMDATRSGESSWRGVFYEAAGRTPSRYDDTGNPIVEGEPYERLIQWSGDPLVPVTPQSVYDTLEKHGHGSSGVIITEWVGGDINGQPLLQAHAYNVFNYHGDIRVADGQIGQTGYIAEVGLHPLLDELEVTGHLGTIWDSVGKLVSG